MPTVTPLQHWMKATGYTDRLLAEKAETSRVHISRIRRGKSGANKKLALRLSAITKISWEQFIEPQIPVPSKVKANHH